MSTEINNEIVANMKETIISILLDNDKFYDFNDIDKDLEEITKCFEKNILDVSDYQLAQLETLGSVYYTINKKSTIFAKILEALASYDEKCEENKKIIKIIDKNEQSTFYYKVPQSVNNDFVKNAINLANKNFYEKELNWEESLKNYFSNYDIKLEKYDLKEFES